MALDASGGEFSFRFDYLYRPRVRDWGHTKAIQRLLRIIESGVPEYEKWLETVLSFNRDFQKISLGENPNEGLAPCWLNGWLPALDSMSLYALIASRRPKRYVEVGSGNSTKFARRAIVDHGLPTKIVSIDPQPRAEIDRLCDEVIRKPCEDVPISFFESVEAGDVVFIDNSHRAFQNSDVTVFFMEILPGLPQGTLVGIHDIFLPEDYPLSWLDRHYNEQYLLACYIQGGLGGGKIVMPNWYITTTPRLLAKLDDIWRDPGLAGLEQRGGAFWFER